MQPFTGACRPVVPLFASAKTTTGIPVLHDAVYAALLLQNFDPSVRRIDFASAPRPCAASLTFGTITLIRAEGRVILDIVDGKAAREPEPGTPAASRPVADADVPTISLTAEEIRNDARLPNARLVWSYRRTPVGIALRLQILEMLADEGPMTFSDLLGAVRTPADPAAALMALACSNLVEIELDRGPIGPSTKVRSCT
jgi:hypothetical protein